MDEGTPVSARLARGALPQRPALQKYRPQCEGRCVDVKSTLCNFFLFFFLALLSLKNKIKKGLFIAVVT